MKSRLILPTHSRSVSGFTLVELLIVIVAISVLVGTAALATGLSDNRRFFSDSQRLQIVLQQAADAALMQQAELGWQLQNGEYRIVKAKGEGHWGDAPERLFRKHAMPAEPSLHLTSEHLTSEHPTANTEQPQIVFYSSGEYSPFQLSLQQGDQIITVSGDGLGDIELYASRDARR